MSASIFISYRRRESSKDARAVYERLRQNFGDDRVFMDLEGIRLGEDFVDRLESQLQECGVLVALVGRNWLGADRKTGKFKLHDDNDFVRIEIRTALRRNIRVLPVLLDGAKMPDSRLLPRELRKFSRTQAGTLKYNTFDADIDRLIDAIRDSPDPTEASSQRDLTLQTAQSRPPVESWPMSLAPTQLTQVIQPGWFGDALPGWTFGNVLVSTEPPKEPQLVHTRRAKKK